MSKKRRRRAPKPAGTIIVIDGGNRIRNPRKVVCNPGSPVAFVVFNQDTIAHTVWIDPDRIVLKRARTSRANPFAKAAKKVKVGAGDFGVIRQRVRPPGAFGKGKLPLTAYKYTIHSGDAAGRRARLLDPDVDVTQPPAF
jgi:hypothetical protein